MKTNLLALPLSTAEQLLRDFFRANDEPAYRVEQTLRRLWNEPVDSFSRITELPERLRAELDATFDLPRLKLVARQKSADGTEKFLFQLADGQAIETVAIPDGKRLTFCISSQAGCALKCAFCATGAMGFARNLGVDEIAGQVRELALSEPALRPTNIVFMGMGEPMMNWEAVDATLTVLNDPRACGVGARHITVSTVGVLPGIVALGMRPEQFRLAISIHAPNDALRRSLMPINVKYPLADVIAAARRFERRVTFEYVMLGDVNDQPVHAKELAALARDCRAFVNLIPLHPGGAGEFVPSTPQEIRAFATRIAREGVEVAVRKSRGTDISAACGQLRVERLRRRAPVRAQQDREVDEAGRIGA
ncbi:MAG: 23S rRNA (adenine(2503)-C(2))-methyltransferase RlmN [Gemmatimonadaceae bacterium]